MMTHVQIGRTFSEHRGKTWPYDVMVHNITRTKILHGQPQTINHLSLHCGNVLLACKDGLENHL